LHLSVPQKIELAAENTEPQKFRRKNTTNRKSERNVWEVMKFRSGPF